MNRWEVSSTKRDSTQIFSLPNMPSLLRADVYVSSRLPIAIKRLGESSAFSPISCTLIQGQTEAVLVDTPISISQTEDLVRWILDTAPGKDLKYVYITHGHGDHSFNSCSQKALAECTGNNHSFRRQAHGDPAHARQI